MRAPNDAPDMTAFQADSNWLTFVTGCSIPPSSVHDLKLFIY